MIRNVFEPHELYMAIQDRVEIASRYLSIRDGALLKLTPRGSAEEQAFMASLAPPAEHPEQVRKNTLQMQLRANALMPSDYVARISKACGLHVVVGSALWGNPGASDAQVETLRSTRRNLRGQGAAAIEPDFCPGPGRHALCPRADGRA